jgi:hypothetical protein
MNTLAGMFNTQAPMSKTQGVGRALAGFGAGVQGRGGEYLSNLQAQDMALDEQRQKAMAKDAMTVYQLLNDNKIDDAINLVDKRVKYISELGGDPTDTLEIRQMLTTPGRLDEARQELGLFVQASMENGLLPAPRVPEQFTLGADEVRYDDQGRVIARGIPKPTDQQGPLTGIAKLRADLAAGRITQADFDAEMARMNQPAAEQRPTAREAEIQDIMATFNVDRAEAIRAMTERTITDPISGNLMRYNPITQTGSVVEMDIPSDTVQLGTPMRAEFEDLAFDPGKGTGFASSFIGLYNSTLGQIPILPISSSRSDAAQNLRILGRDAINALATSSRPAVVEQERIIQALPQAMDWFENPREAQSKTLSFIDLMTQQYVDDRRYSSNARNPRTLREESSRRAGEVERIIGRVLTPDAAEQMFASINKIERSIESVMQVPDSELFTIDPMTLDDAALDAYVERLKNAGR